MSNDNQYRNGLSDEEKRIYDNGYRDATRAINEVLDAILTSGETAERIYVEIAAMVLGTQVVLQGGSARSAKEFASIMLLAGQL